MLSLLICFNRSGSVLVDVYAHFLGLGNSVRLTYCSNIKNITAAEGSSSLQILSLEVSSFGE